MDVDVLILLTILGGRYIFMNYLYSYLYLLQTRKMRSAHRMAVYH